MSKVKVKFDWLSAYGDTTGTNVYYRDPKTGVIVNGEQDWTSNRSDHSAGSSSTNTNTIRAIHLYHPSLERWEVTAKEENIPEIKVEQSQSKYHTTYQPKSHYRFHEDYAIVVNDDKVDMERRENSQTPSAPALEVKQKKARERRTPTPVKLEEMSDEEEKKEFVGWVTNGKRQDLGYSERLLFRKGLHFP